MAGRKRKARRRATSGQKRKIRKVMGEFKRGSLNIGRSRKRVRSRRQAVAIAMSEAGMSRRRGRTRRRKK